MPWKSFPDRPTKTQSAGFVARSAEGREEKESEGTETEEEKQRVSERARAVSPPNTPIDVLRMLLLPTCQTVFFPLAAVCADEPRVASESVG